MLTLSNFYNIRIRRFRNDQGYTGGQRDLRNLNRTTPEGAPAATDEEVAARGRAAGTEADGNIELAEEVIFNVTPVISEARTVNYVDQGLPAPQGLIVYETTNNRRWSISAKFVSRNLVEANFTFMYMNLLKSWAIPQDPNVVGGIFARPPILRLNGYKDQFKNIPVVLTSLNINFPEDVDYIETPSAMVPIIQNIDLELVESHQIVTLSFIQGSVSDASADPLGWDSEFNLQKFKLGQLPGY